jgi:NAD(P)-dependent dehydrogenase (short-subunit alcohol dehydrogenase family)
MVKFAIVTGGNAGLGLYTAAELCRFGFHVTITVRSERKGEDAVQDIRQRCSTASVDYMLMDLSSLGSVNKFATEYLSRDNRLSLLVNNAGIMNTPFRVTEDGFEEQFQVNHLSHFLLTHRLMPLLRAEQCARVVTLSSRAHLRWNQPVNFEDITKPTANTYDGWSAYGRSKTCNILFSKALAELFPLNEDGSGVTFNSLHPGLVNTGLLVAGGMSAAMIANAIPVEEGIETTMYLSTSEEVRNVTGQYFANCKVVQGNEVSKWAQSIEEAHRLFDASMTMCGLSPGTYGQ